MNTLLNTNRISTFSAHLIAWTLLCQATLLAAKESNPANLQINCPQNLTVGIYGNDCTAAVLLPPVTATSSCNGTVTMSYTASWGTGLGPHLGIVAGIYTVTITATDLCSNVENCSMTVTVLDKKAPKPVLVQTLYGNITTDGTVSILAKQFNQNSYDNCSNLSQLKFAFSANATDTIRQYTCADIGVTPILIYVMDNQGNSNTAMAHLEIMDNLNSCGGVLQMHTLARTRKGEPISEVHMTFQQGTDLFTAQTDASGSVADMLVTNQADWKVTCRQSDDPLNGLNTFDIWKLQRYILGQDSLSPYQLIAADANEDKKVTSSDIIFLRKLILGSVNQFQSGKSWTFLPEDFQFQNPKNPFEAPIPEQIVIAVGSVGHQNVAFTGVKIGDLDMSSVPNLQPIHQSRQENPVNNQEQIRIQDAFLRSGKAVDVPVYIEPSQSLAGLQFALSFMPQYIEVISVDAHAASDGEAVHTYVQDENHIINTNFTGNLLPKERTNLITVSVLPKTDGYLSDFISLNTSKLNAEAFNKLGTMYNIQLDYGHPFLVPVVEKDAQPITMIGNSPNPFVEMSILHFSLAQETQATLRVFDADGAQVHVQRSFFTKGSQMFLLKREDLGHPGVFTCRIETELGCVNRKVIMF